MALRTPEDGFLYEMGLLVDAERSGTVLFDLLVGSRVSQPELKELLHAQAEDTRRHAANLDSCAELWGGFYAVPSNAVRGLVARFEVFLTLNPAPDVTDMFAIGMATRFLCLAIVTYENLLDVANLLDSTGRCASSLRDNLHEKRQALDAAQRMRHATNQRLFAR